jgi:hypothetical protein
MIIAVCTDDPMVETIASTTAFPSPPSGERRDVRTELNAISRRP